MRTSLANVHPDKLANLKIPRYDASRHHPLTEAIVWSYMNFALSWNALHRLYSGLIGKSIFIIGLVIPVSKLSGVGIQLQNYDFYLAGSILISIGFIVEKICLPVILTKFDEPISYASHLLERNNLEAFDDRFEFMTLYQFSCKAQLVDKAELSSELARVTIEKSASTILGANKFIYYFGILNFFAIDASKFFIRLICTLLFIAGVAIFYWPMLITTVRYLGGSNVH